MIREGREEGDGDVVGMGVDEGVLGVEGEADGGPAVVGGSISVSLVILNTPHTIVPLAWGWVVEV